MRRIVLGLRIFIDGEAWANSSRPLAAENLDRRAGLVNVVVSPPLNLQIAAHEMDRHLAVKAIGKHPRHANGTSSRSAGERLATATFPDAHVSIGSAVHFYELDVDLAGKGLVLLDQRADSVNQAVGDSSTKVTARSHETRDVGIASPGV